MNRPKIRLRDKNLETAFNAVLDYIDQQPKAKKIYAGNGMTMNETSESITLNAQVSATLGDVKFDVYHPFRVYIEQENDSWLIKHDIGTCNGIPSNGADATVEEVSNSQELGTVNGWVYWEAEMNGVSCSTLTVNFEPGEDPPDVTIPVEKNGIPNELSGLVAFIDKGRIYQILKRNLNVKLDLVMQAQSGSGDEVDNFYSLIPYEL